MATPKTYPRLADVIGFCARSSCSRSRRPWSRPARLGRPRRRKHARLKYTIADRGLDWFRTEVEQRLGIRAWSRRGRSSSRRPATAYGWTEDSEGRWHLSLRIESGRVADRGRPPAALRAGAASPRPIAAHFRLTPNQNLIVADVAPENRWRIDALVAGTGSTHIESRRARARIARLCRAADLPARDGRGRALSACGDRIEALMEKHGLAGEPLLIRVTAAPTAARGHTSPRSRSSARRRAATTCISAAPATAVG